MINLIRQNQRWLMVLIVILTIVSFVWLYNTTDFEKIDETRIAEIYGRTLHRVDIEQQLKVYELAAILGEFEFLQSLGGSARNPDAASSEFIWNLLVLQHEAKRLGIHPTDEQILNAIRAIPALQTKGTFDPQRYQMLLQNVLAPRGMTERRVEDLARDIVKLSRLRELVTSSVAVSEAEVVGAFRGFQAVDAQYCKLEPAAAGPVEATTSEEVEKIFNDTQAQWVTPEYRSVQFVRLELPDGQKNLEGRARVDALQALANEATNFVGQVLEGGVAFESAAQAAKFSSARTPFFDRAGNPPPGGGAIALAIPPALVQASFSLSDSRPLTDIVQEGDSFYIAELKEVLASRPQTLEEARSQIEAQITARKTAIRFAAFSEEQARKIKAAMQSGKSFAEAAKAAGLTVQTLLNYVPFQPPQDENAMIARATLPLNPGEISGLQPAPWGAFIVELTQRAPLDPKVLAEQKGEAQSQLLETKQNLLFFEWLRSGLQEANLRIFAEDRQ